MSFRKSVFLFVIMLGCMSSSFAFSDMPKDHWAYNKVEEMTSKGIITGYTDGTFKPEREVTREEFATILTKTLELKPVGEVVNFRDVDSSRWSKPYIDSSSRYLTGYLNNGNYYFYPESYAVREDMAVAVVKARGLDNEIPNYSVLDRFSDKDKISENLKKYIAIAVENGIMSGNANGTFNPLGNLTRAEITALMCNVLEKVVIEDEIENTHVHKLATKYIYKSETSHTEETYCKTCGEVTESKVKVHSYENDECKCGHEIEHKHEIRTKYVYKNETSHIEQEYCRKCEEVIRENTKAHDYEDEECDCGAKKEHKHENGIKYIYKDETNHIVRTYCKACDEIIGENANSHEYKDGVCVCGAKEAHKHELGTKYVSKDETNHLVETYCKTCNEVISEEIRSHEYKDGKCECGAEEEEIIYGDVNDDGKIDSVDVLQIRLYVGGKPSTITEANKHIGDVDLDGEITENDIWLIQYNVAKNIELPHDCSSHTENYEKIDEEKHKKVEECKCGEISIKSTEKHDFVNGKCICGAQEEKIIYGDANDDGEVTVDDATYILQYISGVKDDINEENADVFIDGEIDAMDSNLIMRYVSKISGTLTHTCGSYTTEDISFGNSKDISVHKVTYLCKCGEINFTTNEPHDFVNGKCICGAQEEEIVYGDANGDGEVTAEDATCIEKYRKGMIDEINEENADVFIDGEIDEFDSNLLMQYLAGMVRDLSHNCGKYSKKVGAQEPLAPMMHEVNYICKCEKIQFTLYEAHDFVEGKCICGAAE